MTVEVFKRSLQYEQEYLTARVMPLTNVDYSFCFYLGWISFVLFILTGIVLLVCSRKRKGIRARSLNEAKENEPINIGRV